MFGKSTRGARGYVIVSSPDGPCDIQKETRQCVHCGNHWIYEPGSGRVRGWCMKCNGVTCGSKQCDPCVPFEARIEIMEGAKERTSRPYRDEFLKSLYLQIKDPKQ
jgi:hypothetical protein